MGKDSATVGRFDWYAATIRDSPLEVERALAVGLEAEVVGAKPLHGYEHAVEFRTATGTAARLLWGGRNGDPHAWASGEDTPAFVGIVRALWPEDHHVTRMDTALDWIQRGVWDSLYGHCVSMADERRLKLGTAGDWVRPQSEDGRTLYVGSMKSPVFVRLYEKGKQLRASVTDGAENIPDDWVRLEAQIRPQREARQRARSASPAEAWGYSGWTKELASRVAGIDAERVQISVYRQADDDRALDFMLRQYGKLLHRMHERAGSWEAVGGLLGERLDAPPAVPTDPQTRMGPDGFETGDYRPPF